MKTYNHFCLESRELSPEDWAAAYDAFWRQSVTPEVTRLVVASLGKATIRDWCAKKAPIPRMSWVLLHHPIRSLCTDSLKEAGVAITYDTTTSVAMIAARDWYNDVNHVHEVKP
jgi:hypothetical protein